MSFFKKIFGAGAARTGRPDTGRETATPHSDTPDGNQRDMSQSRRNISPGVPDGFFEVRRPRGDAACSDNSCPCGFPGKPIPQGRGYIVLDKDLVDWRKKFPSLPEFDVALAIIQSKITASPELKGYIDMAAPKRGWQPILCCEQSPLLREVDREAAATDAKLFWEKGLLPLRPTPCRSQSPVSQEPQSGKLGIQISRCRYIMCTKCRALYDKDAILSGWRHALLSGAHQTVAFGTRTCKCGNVMQVADIYAGLHDLPRQYWNQVNSPVEIN